MPVFDLQDGRDLDTAIERIFQATNNDDALNRLRAVFVGCLDFPAAYEQIPLVGENLPPHATRIARREGVEVVAVILHESNVRADRRRVALKEIHARLGEDVLLVATDTNRDEWQLIYPAMVAGREVLRRMVVRRHEGHRTVIEQLVGMYQAASGGRDFRRALEGAYDVEAVTRRFFQTYRDIFNNVMVALAPTLPDEKERRLSCQKLLNRLLFVRFIEKKGWLQFGASRDYLFALWSDYRTSAGATGNFYQDRLRPLFFDGLNKEPKHRPAGFAERIGTMPYLNGGLFEEGEDDRNPAMVVPDAIFEQIIHRDRAVGLLYHFNFTVTEATPLEVEVAVDPEMLGKVFEELVTGRHESGSYYTPKPVVAFMGREALKGYLGGGAAVERLIDGDGDASAITVPAARQLLMRLDDLRAVDPACGSGAYLLGLLQELLRIYHTLDTRVQRDPRSLYDLKMEIIQRNLYGVDIDPFAVNIARLRLWLSLIVEYDGDDPPPLPNLDFKIETGDSLTAPSPEEHVQLGLHKMLFDEYRADKARYLTEHDHKQRLRARIAALKEQIRAVVHGGATPAGFDWLVEFAEVFADGGFDIVLANPPYVRQELISPLKPTLRAVYPEVYAGTADLYCYFYARALQLLKPGGMLVFISSNKWFRAAYGAKLRAHIAATCAVRSITDFGDLPVFESATAYPMIFVAEKQKNPPPPRYMDEQSNTVFTRPPSLDDPYPDVHAVIARYGLRLPPDALNGANWSFVNADAAHRLRTMTAAGIPLSEYVHGNIYYGVKTGFNEAFVIDGATRARLIAEEAASAEIIKPLAVGRDIHKWRIEDRDRWLIVTKIGVDIARYPTIFAHLQRWQPQLEKRWDKGHHWWELRACDYYAAFDQPKIIFPDIAKNMRFAFDMTGRFSGNTTYFFVSDDLYLLGLLNSSPVEAFYAEMSAQVRGGYLRFFRQYVEQIPIAIPPASERNAIADLVQQCLDARGVGCAAWEAEIDARVAALYGLGT